MIVRLHQIDPADAEALAFWNTTDFRGAIRHTWPADSFAYQVTALDRDEQQQPVLDSIRRRRLRQLLPTILGGLAAPGYQTVLRFDGPLAENELLAVFRHAADGSMIERYCVSPIQQFGRVAAVGSIRVLPAKSHLSLLCNDAQIGLERSVRLRVFSVPEPLVNPLLDASDLDDERWRELLTQSRYILSSVRGMLSLVLWSPTFEPDVIKRQALGSFS